MYLQSAGRWVRHILVWCEIRGKNPAAELIHWLMVSMEGWRYIYLIFHIFLLMSINMHCRFTQKSKLIIINVHFYLENQHALSLLSKLFLSYLSSLCLTYNRTYAAMETLTEPHTLTATLSCMIGMARSLVSPNNHYPEGRVHVLPLLMGSLPGVDPNDFSKCMVSNWCVDEE